MSDNFTLLVGRLPQIAEALDSFDTEALKVEVLKSLIAAAQIETSTSKVQSTAEPNPESLKSPRKGKSRGKVSISLDKNLDLNNPSGMSFNEFVTKNKPRNNQEKLLSSVYWLELERKPESVATVEQVVTCFNHLGWRQPSNPRNALAVVASEKGWLDTADAGNLHVTIGGRNFLEHDMRSRNGE